MFHHQLTSALLVLFLFAFDFALLVLPGFAAAVFVSAKRLVPAPSLIAVIIATAAVTGYLSFWAFFFSKLLGKLFSFAVYLLSAGVLAFGGRDALKRTAKWIAGPLLYTALAGLLYLCFFFLFIDPAGSGASHANHRFFHDVRPGDNVIPRIFAERIYDRQPLHPFCCGGWLSSDRPPLQAGMFLLLRPLPLAGSVDLNYEVIATLLQCLWICGVWRFLESLGASRVRIFQALGLLIFSGFLFYNSVYTWPKLLAAACMLMSFSVVVEIIVAKRAMTICGAALSSTCLGGALMAHPGCIFSLPAFLFTAFRFRHLFTIRQAALAAFILAGFGLPWMAYQKFVDPPGNRMLKIHLADEWAIDSRSTWQVIKQGYKANTMENILHNKWSNLVLLAGRDPVDSFGLGDFSLQNRFHLDRAAAEKSRIAQREWIWNAVGVLNFGWFAALILLWKHRQPAIPFARWLVAVALLDLVFWAIVTFGPNETVTTHSSYTDILLLSIGLLGFVLALPRFVFIMLLALQIFNIFVVWIWSPPATVPVLQLPLLVLGIFVALIVLWRSLNPAREHAPAQAEPRT